MTPEQISIIESTWADMRGKDSKLVALFYDTLLSEQPQYKDLFQSDLKEQNKKFAEMITTIIHGLRYLDRLTNRLKELGASHRDYGVTADDYDVVAEVLLRSISSVRHKPLSPEEAEAWQVALSTLADIMISGK
jgi:nitric oxide dioxygenase